MTPTKVTTDWPKIRVQYHGERKEEIISLDEAAKRFNLEKREVEALRVRSYVGTSVNKSGESDGVYMILVYSQDDSIRDAGQAMLEALESIMDHDLVPRESVAGKIALAAIQAARRD